MLMKNWWKILAVGIILYALTVGILVPLKPGMTEVSPSRAKAGESVTLTVTGYNSHFHQGGRDLRVFLKVGEKYLLESSNVLAKGDKLLHAVFKLPPYFPVDKKVIACPLIIDNGVDGSSVLPSALFISQPEVDLSRAKVHWPITPNPKFHESKGMHFPFRNILAETIRNTFYHVPLWFGMILIFLASVVYNIRFLSKTRIEDDLKSLALIRAGVLFGLLGLVTGAIWAKYTWGEYWSWDVKQNMSAIAILIYLAYFVLRGSIDDVEKRSRISAVYSIFAFAALIPLLFVIPRMTDSLHPGNGGNPGLGADDLDNTMRMVFYPAIIGWTLMGVWIANLFYRSDLLQEKLYEDS